MQIVNTGAMHYALLPWGVLLVEPEPALLAARAELLLAAGQYVAACTEQTAGSELSKIEVRVVILSQTLGLPTLEMLSQQIRHGWPSAFILVFGNRQLSLADWLYDESIDVHCRPEELLSLLHLLQKRARDRAPQVRARIGSIPYGLLGAEWMLRRTVPHESDRTEDCTPSSEEQRLDRALPADEQPCEFGVPPTEALLVQPFEPPPPAFKQR